MLVGRLWRGVGGLRRLFCSQVLDEILDDDMMIHVFMHRDVAN